jgi:NAD(P) transhydrogenase
MNPESAATYGQLALLGAGGSSLGYYISTKITATELPQAVAAFHSLVGVAATATAVGDYILHDSSQVDTFHNVSTYLGAWMGSITATGSVIAYGKLAEKLSSDALALPGRDAINIALGSVSAASMIGFCTTASPTTSALCLAAGTVSSGILGFHMTAYWWCRYACRYHSSQLLLWLGFMCRGFHFGSASSHRCWCFDRIIWCLLDTHYV